MKRPKKYMYLTRSQTKTIYDEFLSSGLTMKTFSKSRGILPTTLRSKFLKFGLIKAPRVVHFERICAFCKLSYTTNDSNSHYCSLACFHNKIRCKNEADVYLRRKLAALKRRSTKEKIRFDLTLNDLLS